MSAAPATTPISDSVSKVDNEIAVGEDLKFQRKWWRFERFIWILFAAIVVLDLLGAFGRGYLAHHQMRTSDGALDVKYENIERYGTPSILKIHFGPAAIHNGKIQLYISQSVVSELGNQRVIPQPVSSVIQQDGILYTFTALPPSGSASFDLQPTRPGIFHISLQVPGEEKLSARIFVVP